VDSDIRSGVRAALACYVMWGGFTAYWKLLDGFAAIDLIGWRILAAGAVLTVLVVRRSTGGALARALRDTTTRRHLMTAALLLAVNWSTYVYAVLAERVIETALGYFLSPLLTVGIGVIVLDERLSRAKGVAIGLVAVAIAVLTMSYGRLPWVALALGGSWSLYGLVKRRVPLSPVESLAGEVLVLAPVALTVVLVRLDAPSGIAATAGATDWALVAGTGLVTSMPLLLFAYAAPRVPFTLLGPMGWLIPVINLGLGWIAFGEEMPASRLAGFALVWVALGIVATESVVAQRRRSSRVVPTTDPADTLSP
jgi:chloramphenicol-sensitive protein RarD